MTTTGKLEGWDHSGAEDIARITRKFDQTTKLIIESDREPAYIKVASYCTNSARYCISSGDLKLSGYDFVDLFIMIGYLISYFLAKKPLACSKILLTPSLVHLSNRIGPPENRLQCVVPSCLGIVDQNLCVFRWSSLLADSQRMAGSGLVLSRILWQGISEFSERTNMRLCSSNMLTDLPNVFLATRWSLMGQCYLESITSARGI